MFISLRGCEIFWAKRQSFGVMYSWVFAADVSAEHMLAALTDNMQPHGSIRISPPFIKTLTHSPYFVADFTCKCLETDRFLSWRTCFRKSPLHVCTLLKVEPRKSSLRGLPVITVFLSLIHLRFLTKSWIASWETLLKHDTLLHTQKTSPLSSYHVFTKQLWHNIGAKQMQ